MKKKIIWSLSAIAIILLSLGFYSFHERDLTYFDKNYYQYSIDSENNIEINGKSVCGVKGLKPKLVNNNIFITNIEVSAYSFDSLASESKTVDDFPIGCPPGYSNTQSDIPLEVKSLKTFVYTIQNGKKLYFYERGNPTPVP